MAESNIEWTNKVWNPTTGCHKISQGCKNCYAEKMHKRLMAIPKIADKYSRPFLMGAFPHEPSLITPLQWKKPAMIFVNSMSDLFHEAIPMDFIAKVYAVMYLTPHHTYQVLTKRPEIRRQVLTSPGFRVALTRHANTIADEQDWSVPVFPSLPLKNVWEGTSVENQEAAQERIPQLMETPAAVRWLSMEPLLGPVNLSEVPGAENLNWIVVGGESGHKRRPFDCEWAQSIKWYCYQHEIPFFMKQIDKVREVPPYLQIREFPAR